MYKEQTLSVFVKSIHQETKTVKRFILAPADGEVLPAFSAGSHITTYLKGLNGPIQRQYSLINHSETRDEYHIAVQLHPSSTGGSECWHKTMRAGDLLNISYPNNHFPLSFAAKRHVFYAAGIGITPILSMMAELKGNKTPFELHYAAKSKDDCAFYEYLRKQYPGHCTFYFSREEGSRRLDAALLLQHPIGTHVYFCGPGSFISTFTETAKGYGYPNGSIHYERFSAPRPFNPKPFEVRLTDGNTINVTAEQTLLEALQKAGIKAPYSCRVGRCGTCELKVLEGKIIHYDSFLTEEQKSSQNCILTCVSRAESERLTISY
ncbi:PDR/VanB family oxidoreductase [Peribacillus sp. SCS-155]|uniref:PDR/VanB family oxidoreductase n=1 Tax=Peribacillus sedimenti TaxID=3115297 RepID=UPI0039063C5D